MPSDLVSPYASASGVVSFSNTVAAMVSFTLPSEAWDGRNSSFQREFHSGLISPVRLVVHLLGRPSERWGRGELPGIKPTLLSG